jgi:hypothetical protein
MIAQDNTPNRVLVETTDRANYLAYEVFIVNGKLLPTGRTLPIVASSRVDASAQLLSELRSLGERPKGCGPTRVTLRVGASRCWFIDRAEVFPNAPADIDGIWLHGLRRKTRGEPGAADRRSASCTR